MATQINKKLALKIAKKLQAVIVKSKKHDYANVYHDGLLIRSFGIRRGSRNNLGHDHIPKDLQVDFGFAKQLGLCPKSLNDFLIEIGIVENPDDTSGT